MTPLILVLYKDPEEDHLRHESELLKTIYTVSQHVGLYRHGIARRIALFGINSILELYILVASVTPT